MFIFKQQFSVSLIAGNAVSKLKRGAKMQNFPGAVTSTRIPNCIWDKPNLLANISLCSDSSQYATLSQSLVQIDRLDILMKVFEDYNFILYLGNLGFV